MVPPPPSPRTPLRPAPLLGAHRNSLLGALNRYYVHPVHSDPKQTNESNIEANGNPWCDPCGARAPSLARSRAHARPTGC